MKTSAIKKMEIIKELSLIPDNKLDGILVYIESILTESKRNTKHNCSLKGIWENSGFEKIPDLDSEIRRTRRQLGNSILNKKL